MVLIGYWPLREDSGSTAYDYSGNGNDATVNGCTVNSDGVAGGSGYQFEYTNNDYLALNTSFSQFSAYTLCGWFKIDTMDTGSFQTLIYPNANNDLHPGIRGSTSSSNYSKLRYWHGDSGGGSVSFVTSSLSKNTWYHWAQVWDGSTMYGYINGEEVGSKSVSSIQSRNDNDDIGYNSSGSSWPFDGWMAEQRIYNHALSPAEIQYLYTIGLRGEYNSPRRRL